MTVKEVVEKYLKDDSKFVLYVNVDLFSNSKPDGTVSYFYTKYDGWDAAIIYFGPCSVSHIDSYGSVVEITLAEIVDIEDRKLLSKALLAFKRHRDEVDVWEYGDIVSVFNDDKYDVCIQYQTGHRFYYSYIDLPFFTICE